MKPSIFLPSVFIFMFFALSGFAQTCPVVPTPNINSQIAFCQDEVPVPLSAIAEGPNLRWYAQPFGGTGSPVAPIPSTAVPGITDYYISSSDDNGCESARLKISSIVYEICYWAALVDKTQTLPVNGPVSFSHLCDDLITRIVPGGAAPLRGNTTARVWFDAVQQPGYVKRHYQITPDNNPTGATARVYLYFKQVEFDAFNAVNTVQLPTGPDDAPGISRFVLQKRGGVSIDGSGSPASFTGPVTMIDPDDNDIFYDYASYRWQVGFNVTGFSGFFAGSFASLPVKWLQLGVVLNKQHGPAISWAVKESNVEGYSIEQSDDGHHFTRLADLIGQGDGEHRYSFSSSTAITNKQFYRILQKDRDGKFTYSGILSLLPNSNGVVIAYPNPVQQTLTLTVPENLQQTNLLITDVSGRLVKQVLLKAGSMTMDAGFLHRGLYLLKFTNGQTVKLLKQ